MFSPWYFASRRWGRSDPDDHCTLNVLLRGPNGGRFAMTERGRASVVRDATSFSIGPSSVRWDGAALCFAIHERGSPIPRAVRGEVRVHPLAMTAADFALDPERAHRWWPISPACRIEVAMLEPSVTWSGTGYLDSNWGSRALEADFSRWDWCCARLDDGGSAVFYERWLRDGTTDCLALAVDRAGAMQPFDAPPRVVLPKTRWRLARLTRAEAVSSVRTMDDTPFYARSVLRSRLRGRDVTSMHESLSLDRFRTPWMQAMLPFRMRRW